MGGRGVRFRFVCLSLPPRFYVKSVKKEKLWKGRVRRWRYMYYAPGNSITWRMLAKKQVSCIAKRSAQHGSRELKTTCSTVRSTADMIKSDQDVAQDTLIKVDAVRWCVWGQSSVFESLEVSGAHNINRTYQ